jgi:hypothetical protein
VNFSKTAFGVDLGPEAFDRRQFESRKNDCRLECSNNHRSHGRFAGAVDDAEPTVRVESVPGRGGAAPPGGRALQTVQGGHGIGLLEQRALSVCRRQIARDGPDEFASCRGAVAAADQPLARGLPPPAHQNAGVGCRGRHLLSQGSPATQVYTTA